MGFSTSRLVLSHQPQLNAELLQTLGSQAVAKVEVDGVEVLPLVVDLSVREEEIYLSELGLG